MQTFVVGINEESRIKRINSRRSRERSIYKKEELGNKEKVREQKYKLDNLYYSRDKCECVDKMNKYCSECDYNEIGEIGKYGKHVAYFLQLYVNKSRFFILKMDSSTAFKVEYASFYYEMEKSEIKDTYIYCLFINF